MKYIKKYEKTILKDLSSDCYWLIPTDNRLIDSLKQIREYIIDPFFKQEFINIILSMTSIKNQKFKYIYVRVNLNNEGDKWGFLPYIFAHAQPDGKSEIYEQKNCKFMGKINITDEELSALKYNL